MIPHLRRQFNQNWTAEKYSRFLGLLEKRTGLPLMFRHSETPCFFPLELIERTAAYGREMVEALLADPEYRRASQRAVPAAWDAPREDAAPLFVQADFGLVLGTDGEWQPKLVEIQGFPSLYAYQPMLAECYRETYGLDDGLRSLAPGLDLARYHELLRKAIVGDADPESVVLMEIDPGAQKTRADFVLTERLCGIRTVDIPEIRKQGRRLYYRRDGLETPIRRIYNRAIVDELERRRIPLPFDFRDDLDVEWAGHPNWFFRLSKFSLPYLRHPAVPWSRFLSEVEQVEEPERFVLKPLFSFAGLGVVVGPTRAQLATIPEQRRGDYILQERMNFAPVIETPAGATKAEIRCMYLWLDGLQFVNTLIRTGRGAMMGVDHNKGLDWVGASAGFLA